MIDIRTLLGDEGIPFWISGKNVSDGWTSISCPMCGDRSNHGAFNPEGGYSCFRCGKHNSKKVIAEFVGWDRTIQLFKEYSDILKYQEDTHTDRVSNVEWPPPSATEELPSVHASYLFKRRYDVKHIREYYNVLSVYYNTDFKYRLIIPVYYKNRIVTYVGRDITDKAALKYKNLSERKSVYPAKECVYNLDNVYDTAIICEGIFDAWRFGAHGVALFGIQFTPRQTNLLAMQLKRAFVLFDSEPQAQNKAHELCEVLAMQGVTVENIVIDEYNDPGDMPQDVADEVKQELLLT